MKIKELHQKTEKELRDLLIKDRLKLGQLKFDLASKKLKNIKEIRDLRRQIARIITILNSKKDVKEEK